MQWTRRQFAVGSLGAFAMPSLAWALQPTPMAKIRTLVTRSQKAGFEKNDWQGYIAPWSREAKWIAQRTAKGDAHTVSFGYDAGLARIRLRAESQGPALRMTHSSVDARIGTDPKTGTLSMKTSIGVENYSETVQEHYKLVHTKTGWTITENRFWILETRSGKDITTFDDAYFAKADAAVEAARKVGPIDTILAMYNALRWADAHTIAVEMTSKDGAPADAWAMRAQAAYMRGMIKDAEKSVKAARNIDPKVLLPPWAKAIKK